MWLIPVSLGQASIKLTVDSMNNLISISRCSGAAPLCTKKNRIRIKSKPGKERMEKFPYLHLGVGPPVPQRSNVTKRTNRTGAGRTSPAEFAVDLCVAASGCLRRHYAKFLCDMFLLLRPHRLIPPLDPTAQHDHDL